MLCLHDDTVEHGLLPVVRLQHLIADLFEQVAVAGEGNDRHIDGVNPVAMVGVIDVGRVEYEVSLIQNDLLAVDATDQLALVNIVELPKIM